MGITDTIKEALERLSRDEEHKKACKALLSMRGKYTFSLDLDELRKDRDEA